MQENTAISACMPLPPSEIRRAADLLAKAFYTDPMYEVVLPDEAKRTEQLSWLFERVIRYSLRYGQCHTTTALEGISCWLLPGETKVTVPRVLRSGFALTPFKMGRRNYRRFNTCMELADQFHAQVAPKFHWYLWAIGVDPSCQGKGVGGKLLHHVFEQADAHGTPCYLETGTERNVRFYEKHGFKVVKQGSVIGVPIWAMLRETPSSERR